MSAIDYCRWIAKRENGKQADFVVVGSFVFFKSSSEGGIDHRGAFAVPVKIAKSCDLL